MKNDGVKMSALTNSTYDGVCYNVINIKKQLEKSVQNLHFDEAWYAYARFHPLYKDHYGMTDDDLDENHPPIFCSHSTHKLLTAFLTSLHAAYQERREGERSITMSSMNPT
jgi:arginine decarboxylase